MKKMLVLYQILIVCLTDTIKPESCNYQSKQNGFLIELIKYDYDENDNLLEVRESECLKSCQKDQDCEDVIEFYSDGEMNRNRMPISCATFIGEKKDTNIGICISINNFQGYENLKGRNYKSIQFKVGNEEKMFKLYKQFKKFESSTKTEIEIKDNKKYKTCKYDDECQKEQDENDPRIVKKCFKLARKVSAWDPDKNNHPNPIGLSLCKNSEFLYKWIEESKAFEEYGYHPLNIQEDGDYKNTITLDVYEIVKGSVQVEFETGCGYNYDQPDEKDIYAIKGFENCKCKGLCKPEEIDGEDWIKVKEMLDFEFNGPKKEDRLII
jgi:hypothetical protein